MFRRTGLRILICVVLLVLCAALEPIATPVGAQLACPPDVDKVIRNTAALNLDKVLKFYDSWAGKELKAGRKPGTGLNVAVCIGSLAHEVPIFYFWGAVRRLQELGCNVDYMVAASTNDYAAAAENLMAKNPDAIVLIAGNNQTLGSALEKAAQKKIPVFGFDNWIDGRTVISEATSNNFDIGVKAATYMVQQLRGKGSVAILYAPGMRSIDIRRRMYKELLQEFVNIKEIAELAYTAGVVVDSSRSRMEALLVANPKKGSINAVFACYDTPGYGAADAIEAAGREDEIFVVGIDGDREALRRIARGDGAFRATVSQSYLQMGTAVSCLVVDHLKGKQVPRFVYVPVELVTKDNAKQHYKEKYGEDLKL
ncbi:MAG: sugar ABC transporter substrate-binding protein [Bacillota bacterium]